MAWALSRFGQVEASTAQAGDAAAEQSEQLERTARKADTSASPVKASRSRRTIVSYSSYTEAERAVDWLFDQGFAVERGAIVGRGLRSVEQLTGRMTAGRAALIGAGEGAQMGALFFSGPDLAGLLLYALAVGGAVRAMRPGSRTPGAGRGTTLGGSSTSASSEGLRNPSQEACPPRSFCGTAQSAL